MGFYNQSITRANTYERPNSAKGYRRIEALAADGRLEKLTGIFSVNIPAEANWGPNKFGWYTESTATSVGARNVLCSGAGILIGDPGTGGDTLGITLQDGIVGQSVSVATKGFLYLPVLDTLGMGTDLNGVDAFWTKATGVCTDTGATGSPLVGKFAGSVILKPAGIQYGTLFCLVELSGTPFASEAHPAVAPTANTALGYVYPEVDGNGLAINLHINAVSDSPTHDVMPSAVAASGLGTGNLVSFTAANTTPIPTVITIAGLTVANEDSWTITPVTSSAPTLAATI